MSTWVLWHYPIIYLKFPERCNVCVRLSKRMHKGVFHGRVSTVPCPPGVVLLMITKNVDKSQIFALWLKESLRSHDTWGVWHQFPCELITKNFLKYVFEQFAGQSTDHNFNPYKKIRRKFLRKLNRPRANKIHKKIVSIRIWIINNNVQYHLHIHFGPNQIYFFFYFVVFMNFDMGGIFLLYIFFPLEGRKN